MLEAVKQRGGDPPAFTCRFLIGVTATAGDLLNFGERRHALLFLSASRIKLYGHAQTVGKPEKCSISGKKNHVKEAPFVLNQDLWQPAEKTFRQAVSMNYRRTVPIVGFSACKDRAGVL